MPGPLDPTNLSLPQQPLHSCLFPQGNRFSSLHLVTNPYSFNLDGYSIMGHSGQPVQDILRQTRSIVLPNVTDINDESNERQQLALNTINALRKTILWGHLAPTAPDTLACHPFTDMDPFILDQDQLPRIMFSGCQVSNSFYKLFIECAI